MGLSPARKMTECKACGGRAQGTVRYGGKRGRVVRPSTFTLEYHFPPGSRDVCDASEVALPREDWPAWALEALTKAGKP